MIYAIAAVLVLVLDQAVKFWTTRNIPLDAIGDDCVELISNVVHMTNVHNTGAAFSILANARWLLVGVSVVFVIGIIILISQEIIHSRFGKWTAVLVMAGALGNCIDRVLYGYVVDMFEVELFKFAVFNVADIFITVCGILFCIHVILYKDPAAAQPVEELPEEEEPSRDRKAPKEDPYAAIPHRDRSEHRSLDEETRPANPDDPFAEWGFGDVVEDSAPRRAQKADTSAEAEPTPRRVREPEPVSDPTEDDDWSAALDLDKIAASRSPKKEPEAAPAPAPKKVERPVLTFDELDMPLPGKKNSSSGEDGNYSLEDILSEFRDLDL